MSNISPVVGRVLEATMSAGPASTAADDWLREVEQSTEAVNATSTPTHGSGADTGSINPFLRPTNNDTPISKNLNESEIKPQRAGHSASVKENVSPLNNSMRRKSRKLPELCPSPAGRMKRSMSLSFLPQSTPDGGGSGRSRRRLPEVGQGRLIQQVADKLEEEARVRLEVARELKDEKRKRWKLEDQFSDLQRKNKKFEEQLNERRKECAALRAEIDEERRLRGDAEAVAASTDKQLKRVQAEMSKMRATEDHHASAAMDSEEALREAWQATFDERRRRQHAEGALEQLKRGIAKMGGAEVLKQILASAEDWAEAATPSPAASPHAGGNGKGNESIVYESTW